MFVECFDSPTVGASSLNFAWNMQVSSVWRKKWVFSCSIDKGTESNIIDLYFVCIDNCQFSCDHLVIIVLKAEI